MSLIHAFLLAAVPLTTPYQKEELKKTMSELKGNNHAEKYIKELTVKGKCSVTQGLKTDPETNLYLFVSFSMPDEAWISLSKEAEKIGAIFVLRGLPENSFQTLSIKMQDLRKKGMRAAVQINPRLFDRFEVSKVPCFVSLNEEKFDKISGNISLNYALKKMRKLL
jgi:conjugal transfer pilus assembly protein TrbC